MFGGFCKNVLPVAAALAWIPGLATADDATALLKRAAAAMGAVGLNTIAYGGTGTAFGFGQSWRPGIQGPKLNLVSQTRSINYQSASMRDQLVLSRAEQPARGGTPVPPVGELRQDLQVSGAEAWAMVGTNAIPNPVAVGDRQHQLWLTPHGIIKAAMRNNATVRWQNRGGKHLAAVSFTEPGKFSAKVYINDDYIVERIESRVSNPVVGDMKVETDYSGYIDFSGVKFPTRIQQVQGGFPLLDLRVNSVQINAPVAIRVPDALKKPILAVSTKAAEGVWFVAGGSHNSVAIEMKDHVVVVEGPLSDGRAGPVIDEVKRLVPKKPIRYVVNSHHHFDHAGGLRAFAAAGATIVTHAINKPFFERAYAAPRVLAPDRLAKSKKKAMFRTVKDKLVLTDGSRTIEIHHIRGNTHNDGMLMAWLPKEKFLIEADAFTPTPKPPAQASPFTVNLVENIERLKLPVERILPLHGGMVPVSALYQAIGRKG